MCGIVGFIKKGEFSNYDSLSVINLMTDKLKHRGPDSSGVWINENNNIALGHRRLSVLELSDSASQPMLSDDKRFVIVFNGEIYNHHELRKEIPEIHWRDNSDTSTLINLIQRKGIEYTLNKINGMFAFSIYDNLKNILIVARDRAGEKPLYYGDIQNTFVFSSELKSIVSHPEFKSNISQSSLSSYFKTGYIKSPNSIYHNIYKLPPGSYLEIDLNNYKFEYTPKYYWTIENVIKNKCTNRFQLPYKDAVDELDFLLNKVIKKQMLSDVPLGSFLSGGVDSSLITSIMQFNTNNKVKSFSVGFNEKKFDESSFALNISKHLGTDHTETIMNSDDAFKILMNIHNIYDEPFADSSQLPTIFVSQIAQKNVTVSLSGDAGDELFCGYDRYIRFSKLWKLIDLVPDFIKPILYKYFNNNIVINILKCKNSIEFYTYMTSQSKDVFYLINKIESEIPKFFINIKNLNYLEQMMYWDFKNYLCDDILVKVDRAAMSTSLETRVPFLDQDIIEFAWRLPINFKYKSGVTKAILKDVLQKYIPRELFERPKMGFGVPISHWLKTTFRDLLEEALSESNLKKSGYLNSSAINKILKDHLDNVKDNSTQLWTIFMFQLWFLNNNKI
jgi:asparagine synthase (glutamine-hydrolysing)